MVADAGGEAGERLPQPVSVGGRVAETQFGGDGGACEAEGKDVLWSQHSVAAC